MADTSKKILIIDGHSILNRAFYGLPDLTNYEGLHTNAVLGFLNIIFKIMEEENPTNMCVAFDVKQPTFRHLMYKEYKGTRKPMPEELRQQVPLIKEVLESMKVTIIEKGGYEADDIIGTLSRKADAAGYSVVILSGDRDLLQLATDNILVRIPKTKATGTTVENYYAKDVQELYGVTPFQFIDMKGLMGDTSDNIPGVPGIGEKTASKIIKEFGSIENAIEHVDEVKPAKASNNLREFSDQAVMSKELATIKLDCELDIDLESTKAEDMFNSESQELFKRLEFKSLLKKFEGEVSAPEFKANISVVSDDSEIEQIFQKAKEMGKLGISVITDGYEIYGVTLAFDNQDTYIIDFSANDRTQAIYEKLEALTKDGVILYDLDLKNSLNWLPFEEEDKNVLDVGVAAYLINPLDSDYDYEALAKRYMGIVLPGEKELIKKAELNAFSFLEEGFKNLYAYRAIVAVSVGDKLIEMLKTQDMYELYTDIEMPTLYTLYDMEKRGIRVDRDALLDYSNKLTARIDELTASITAHAGRQININSPKQLGVLLFEEMGILGGKKTKTGYSTSVEVLEKIKGEHPIIEEILEYRQLTKLNSTYAVGLTAYIKDDGRIHGKFNQTITATGRISSTEPNLQNIPMKLELGRLIRKAFTPKEGYVFIDADYSQVELRVLAHLSGDKVMQEAFKCGVDIHTSTAASVFGVAEDEVTPLLRRHAKAVNFGIVYGMSAFGLSEDLGISRKEAADFIEKYYDTYKGVKNYMDMQVQTAKEKGYVTTMFNRVRPIPELKSSNFMQRSFGERVAMNSPIQGSAADIIKIAMVKVNRRLKKENMKSQLILQIHDELLIEAEKSEADKVEEILVEEMVNAVNMDVPLVADAARGNNWYEAK